MSQILIFSTSKTTHEGDKTNEMFILCNVKIFLGKI